MIRKLQCFFASLFTLLFIPCTIFGASPKNVILMIGDGMGFEHVRAAGMYENGMVGTLSFELLPYQGEVTTYSANSSITDSAAAATAISTESKVNNGVISMAIPGDFSELYTLLEYLRDMGKSTGLITTSYMTDATPAAFGAHENSRNNTNQIALDYLQQTRPNILFGGGGYGMSIQAANDAGYTVINDFVGLEGLNTSTESMVSGQFGTGYLPYEYDYFIGTNNGYNTLPHLSEMTATALDILDNDTDGFFLMVEGENIDTSGHTNQIEKNIFEIIEFSRAVQTVLNWAGTRSDTLILVTADHETGGLSVLQNNGQGVFPTVSWSTGGHTSVNVPIYAWGQNANLVSGVLDNTDIYFIATFDADCSNLPVRIAYTNPIYFQSIQSAYNSAGEGDIIQSQEKVFIENINIDRSKSVIIQGGYDCNYMVNHGITTIRGQMIISNGTSSIDNFSIE